MRRPRSIRLTDADRTRFWRKVDTVNPFNCWIWRGARTRTPGRGDGWEYGVFRNEDGVLYMAHRVAWAIEGLALLPDHVLMQSCTTPLCVNPQHWRQVGADEYRRSMGETTSIWPATVAAGRWENPPTELPDWWGEKIEPGGADSYYDQPPAEA